METEQQRLKKLLTDAIPLLCKNGLGFQSKFCIEALIGITLDESEVFLVSFKETVTADGETFSHQWSECDADCSTASNPTADDDPKEGALKDGKQSLSFSENDGGELANDERHEMHDSGDDASRHTDVAGKSDDSNRQWSAVVKTVLDDDGGIPMLDSATDLAQMALDAAEYGTPAATTSISRAQVRKRARPSHAMHFGCGATPIKSEMMDAGGYDTSAVIKIEDDDDEGGIAEWQENRNWNDGGYESFQQCMQQQQRPPQREMQVPVRQQQRLAYLTPNRLQSSRASFAGVQQRSCWSAPRTGASRSLQHARTSPMKRTSFASPKKPTQPLSNVPAIMPGQSEVCVCVCVCAHARARVHALVRKCFHIFGDNVSLAMLWKFS